MLTLIFIFIFGCFLTPCSYANTYNKVAAIINSDIITAYDVNEHLKKMTFDAHILDKKTKFRMTLNELIDEKLFKQLVIDHDDITVTDDDLTKAVENILQQYQMNRTQLRKELKTKGLTFEKYKDDLRYTIRKTKFIEKEISPKIKITDQDLRDYFQHNQKQFRSAYKAHIAQIVLPLTMIKSQTEFESLHKKTLQIIKRIKKGSSFSSQAQKYSKGPYADKGGDMGMMDVSVLPIPVSKAIRTMTIGDISQPILTNHAIVIVKIISLPELSASNFTKLKNTIFDALYNERMKSTLKTYLNKKRHQAFIDIR